MFEPQDKSTYNHLIYSSVPVEWFAYMKKALGPKYKELTSLEEFCREARAVVMSPELHFLSKYKQYAPIHVQVAKEFFDDLHVSVWRALKPGRRLPPTDKFKFYFPPNAEDFTRPNTKFPVGKSERIIGDVAKIIDRLYLLYKSIVSIDKKLDSLPKPIDEALLDRLIDRAKELEDKIIWEEGSVLKLVSAK